MEKYFLQKENMEKYICALFFSKKWKTYVLQKEKMETYFLCMFVYF